MRNIRNTEYEKWIVVYDAASLALQVGLDTVINDIIQQYEEMTERLADPRSFGPDRDVG